MVKKIKIFLLLKTRRPVVGTGELAELELQILWLLFF